MAAQTPGSQTPEVSGSSAGATLDRHGVPLNCRNHNHHHHHPTSARHRGDRQLRAFHRHELLTVKMELATAFHHSARRPMKRVVDEPEGRERPGWIVVRRALLAVMARTQRCFLSLCPLWALTVVTTPHWLPSSCSGRCRTEMSDVDFRIKGACLAL